MRNKMINQHRLKERIHFLNNKPVSSGDYILYWMQASQREECNHALEYAIHQANSLYKPLIVFFCILDAYPEASRDQYQFMLEGLQETQKRLAKRHIPLVVQKGKAEKTLIDNASDASLVVCDRGYLRFQRQWRQHLRKNIDCSCIEVETDVVVPVETASNKEEYAAATIRSKIKRQLPNFLQPLSKNTFHQQKTIPLDSLDVSNTEDILDSLTIPDQSNSSSFKGGFSAAKDILTQFIHNQLDDYENRRNDPSNQISSNMSPYLHFGQISPITIALAIIESHSPSIDTYLEELIIRRELSMNYVWYNEKYDTFQGLPTWAQDTLNDHQSDHRDYDYSLEDLEKAQTHDPYWNAAQTEMMTTGKMHGYMRMYWGKKILEWTEQPQDAFQRALFLNNKYELDGRDPNGYTGVAWCFGKHDHPWKERAIFGKVRYMNDKGLQRKFDINAYVDQIQQLKKL